MSSLDLLVSQKVALCTTTPGLVVCHWWDWERSNLSARVGNVGMAACFWRFVVWNAKREHRKKLPKKIEFPVTVVRPRIMSHSLLFISCLFLLAPFYVYAVADDCNVVINLYGSPTCREFVQRCDYTTVSTGGCVNYTLADTIVSIQFDCTNKQTNYYDGVSCIGSPVSTGTNVTSDGCATANSWYFTVDYDETGCTAAASRADSLMLAALSWFF
jgi:hypothetical protein